MSEEERTARSPFNSGSTASIDADIDDSHQTCEDGACSARTGHVLRGRQGRYVTHPQSRRRQTGIAITCVSVLLVGYLLIYAESNPESGNGRGADCSGKERKERNDSHDNTAILSSLTLS